MDYLSALSRTGIIRPLSKSEASQLNSIQSNFSDTDAGVILAHERETRHDVKAIEYFLRDKFAGTSLTDIIPWLHFGLTSEDVNNMAQAIALRDARDSVLLPALDDLLGCILEFARAQRALPMLARTHGQPAVPTTLGKEYAVFHLPPEKRTG